MRVEIVSVALYEKPSCVKTAVLRLLFVDGTSQRLEVELAHRPMYETLEDDIRDLNRVLERRRSR